MTKELSKKICELCAIEEKLDNQCKRQIGELCLVEGIKDECRECEYFDENISTYPDFGEPENFVRLINLYHSEGMYIKDTQDLTRNFKDKFSDGFLRDLLFCLCNPNDDEEIYDMEERLNGLKQAIKNIEWRY